MSVFNLAFQSCKQLDFASATAHTVAARTCPAQLPPNNWRKILPSYTKFSSGSARPVKRPVHFRWPGDLGMLVSHPAFRWAVVFEGHHFVTSPNMDHIYAPPRSKRMTFKTDYHLAEHDQLLCPQPYLELQCHLACIPRRQVFDESFRPPFSILFHPVGFRDF